MDSKAFFYDLGKAIYRIDTIYDTFAKKSNIAPALLWVLYALNDGGQHTQREICAVWELPKSTVNTVMTELKRKGFVELAPIKGKRREMTIILTEDGKKYADRILEGIYKKEAEIFEKLSGEELHVIKYMEKIVSLLKE